MKEYLFVLAFLIAIPVSLYLIFKPGVRQREVSNGVINYDSFMRKFCFSIDATKEEVYSQLNLPNVYDVLEYDLDEENDVITFKRYVGGRYSYRISVDEAEGCHILWVEQIPSVMGGGNVPCLINEFFIKKLDAKPIDYTETAYKRPSKP